VTYGTGAIGGVINIITKNGRDNPKGFSAGFASNATYDSDGVNLQYTGRLNDWDIYGYVSYRETDGHSSPDYYSMSAGNPSDIRYVGKKPSDTLPPQDFLADSNDRAQIKAHLHLNKGEDFSVWLRYTQSGQVRFFTTQGEELDGLGNVVDVDNRSRSQTRSLILSSDYRHDFGDGTALNTSVTFDSQEYVRYRYLNQGSDNNIKDYAFSQDRIKASALYDFNLTDDINVIAGYEYARIDVGAPWGESSDHLWIREGTHIISDWDTSVYTQNLALSGRPNPADFVEVGSGMRFETHSHLLESQWQVTDKHKLFYAHRLDFPDVAERMFSPRLSLVTTLDDVTTFVSSIQRAQRMMPLRAQYLNEINDGSSDLETIDSLEFSYTTSPFANTSMNIRAYYNDIHAVGYTGQELQFLAEYDIYGLEFSATYKTENWEVTLNHMLLKLIDMQMNDDLKTGDSRNNISFADYYHNTRSGIPILLEDYGDGLNNWPENITKLLVTRSFLDHRLKAHLNAQIYWDYDGSYDEMGMYQQAYENFDRSSLSVADQAIFDQQYADFLREKELLDDEDAFDIDYNVNLSLVYHWQFDTSTEVMFKVFAENVLRSSYRYNVSTGSNQTVPSRLEFMDKPRMYGASVQVSF
jgi:hypothetical protein